MANVSVHDYLQAGRDDDNGIFMPLTMRIDSNLTRASLRSTFADLPLAQQPRVSRPVPISPSGKTDHWLPWERNNFTNFLTKKANNLVKGRTILPFETFFMSLFNRPPPDVLHFAQGAQFAASREDTKDAESDVLVAQVSTRAWSHRGGLLPRVCLALSFTRLCRRGEGHQRRGASANHPPSVALTSWPA